MSKPMELTVLGGSASTMSAVGQGDTDVGGMAPLYSSIEAAQHATRQYQQVRLNKLSITTNVCNSIPLCIVTVFLCVFVLFANVKILL